MSLMPPLIRLEVQGMRQEMIHAFAGYADNLKIQMEEALDAALNEFDIDRIAYDEALRMLREVVRDSVRSAIANQVAKEITERFKVAFPDDK